MSSRFPLWVIRWRRRTRLRGHPNEDFVMHDQPMRDLHDVKLGLHLWYNTKVSTKKLTVGYEERASHIIGSFMVQCNILMLRNSLMKAYGRMVSF